MPVVNPGIRRYIGSAIQRLFNSASFSAPLTHSLTLERGTGTPTFTRATTGTVQDNEGILRTAIAGEARFTGARRVRNLLPSTEGPFNAGSGWTVLNGTVTSGVEDPEGGTTAYTLTQVGASSCELYPTTPFVNSGTLSSVWIRRRAGTGPITLYGGDTANNITAQVTSEWQRLSVGVYASSAVGFDLRTWTDGDAIDFWHPQAEDITGRTDQTTPSEYVSVGALDYRSTQDPLYLSIPNSASHTATCPDTASLNPSSTISIRIDYAADLWTAGSFINHAGAGDYGFFVDPGGASGALRFGYSNDGTALRVATSSVVPGFTNGTRHRIRYDYNVATGAVDFYTATVNGDWVALGTQQSLTAGTIFNSTAVLRIGNRNANDDPAYGKWYGAEVYVDGVLVKDFNPQRDATTPTGTITSSTTGEVWTINGASSVVRNAAYHGAGVDGVKCFDTDIDGNPIAESTLKGYLAEGAATNLLLQSAVVATQNIAVTAAAHTLSFKGTGTITLSGTSTAGPLVGTGATDRVTLTFTPTAGTLTLTVSGSCTEGQLELGSSATSYIPTTTVAVARNADLLTYTGADVANIKTLACTFQRAVGVSGVGVIATHGDGTANEHAYADLTSATALQFAGYDGGVLQWDTTASNAYTPGATAKLAFSLATNDVKMDFNGTAQTADTSATMPTATQVQVGHVNGSFQLTGNVGGIYGWTRNLSQSELGAVDR